MSKKENDLVGQGDAASSDVVKSDTVSYDSHRKSVDREKKAVARAKELEDQVEAYRQKDLEDQGKHEEVIATLRKQLGQSQSELKETKSNFVYSQVDSAIENEFTRRGCSNPKKALKLLSDADYKTLEVDETTFRVKEDGLKALGDNFQKENEFFFSKKKVEIDDIAPQGNGFKRGQPNFGKMTQEELVEYGRKHF